MLNSFKLFLNYDMEKIAVLNSAEEASETLIKYKMQNRMIGLVIVDCTTIGTGVYNFLKDIFDRNINADIILTGAIKKDDLKILREFTNLKVGDNNFFISDYLQTPIHTERFVKAIQRLHFGQHL
jgi:response regulator of citrate/malate metabolism